MNFKKKINNILKSNNVLTYVCTEEENRLEQTLITINELLFDSPIYIWDFIDGYKNNLNHFSTCKQNPLEALEAITKHPNAKGKVFFLKDFNNFINDISISRKLKNLYQWLQKNSKYVILSGSEHKMPKGLEEYINYVKLPLPNTREISIELNNFFCTADSKIVKQKDIICKAYTGFSIQRVRLSIAKIILNKVSTKKIVKEILKEKDIIFNNKDGIRFYSEHNNNLSLGGLNNLKNWLKIRNLTYTQQAYAYGIRMPRGILLVGVQGTGKSLSAQIISNEWKIPLLRIDTGKIFAGILGESENKIEKIIETCNNMAPCILWIDEIDKIFTDNGNTYDSGTTQRVTNIFLTWLSEKKSDVFVFATANKIEKLPIEILRKGRFDEIFFVDLPNFKERTKIFQIHLKKIRPYTWNKYNIYYLSKLSHGFSGAEIEQCIKDAMYNSFYEKREFTTLDVIKCIKKTIPLSTMERNKISKLRQWGHSGKVKVA